MSELVNPCPAPTVQPVSNTEARYLAIHGYVPRAPFFDPEFADALPEVVDQGIKRGLIKAPADRVVAGIPTEWIFSMGAPHGTTPDSAAFVKLPYELRQLFEALQALGDSYNSARAAMLDTRAVTEDEVLPVEVGAMEMNVNRTVGTSKVQWSGLHLHDDRTRFNAGLQAVQPSSVYHETVRARALTVSGYARPVSADGKRRDDLGGALPFVVRRAARNPRDRNVFDIVPAYHNTGALFFPGTLHGVARMPAGSVRYSFQAFFPGRRAWGGIQERFANHELTR